MTRLRSSRRILLALLRLGVGVGLLVYLAKSKIIDFHTLSRLAAEWPVSLAAMVFLFVDMALMAWRLCFLFRPQGMRFRWIDSLQLTSISAFFATFLPGRAGGDLAKIFYAAKEKSGRRTEIVTVLLFDRSMGLFSLLLLPLLLAPMFPELLRSPSVRIALSIAGILALAMLAGFFLCIFAPVWVNRLAGRPCRLLNASPFAGRFIAAVGAYGRSPCTVAGALGISLVDNLLGVGVVALALFVVHPSGLEAKLCVVAPLGQIVNSLPLTPGGLGVGETAFHTLFGIAGLKGGAEAMLCWRIWNAMIGVFGLILYVRGFRTRILNGPSGLAGVSP